MNRRLDHEKLEVYQVSLAFITWLEPVLKGLPKSLAVVDPSDRASTSIPLNIAEVNEKFTGPDRCRDYDNARGSALECAAALDVIVAKGQSPDQDVADGKAQLRSIVLRLVGLIKANSSYRLHEKGYGSGE